VLWRWAKGVVNAFLKDLLLLEEHVRVDTERELDDDYERNDKQLEIDHRENRLILLAAVLRLHVVSCDRSVVLKVVLIILKDIRLKVLLKDSVHRDPIEQRKQVHLVQDCVETKVNQKILRVVDAEVSQEDFCLDEVTVADRSFKVDDRDEEFNEQAFLLMVDRGSFAIRYILVSESYSHHLLKFC
jgi:hypothetical protein